MRYHGTLAPNARWRRLVVPAACVAGGDGGACHGSRAGARGGEERADWIPWSELMRRVFAEDVLECPRCGGRMRVIAAVTNPDGIRRILEHLGLPARPPPLAPARLAEDEWGD